MHPFEATLSVAGAFVLAVMVLTLFFKLVGWVGERFGSAPRTVTFQGVLDDRTPATIHLSNGTTFQEAVFLGFADPASAKSTFPYELNGMVVFKLPDGRRFMIRPKLIRMIEVPPAVV